MKHENSGLCQKCWEIMDKYPHFNTTLFNWFTWLQKMHPDAHISCAGRGKADQEAAVKAGTSRAQYGQSAHNYNAAIDLFQLKNGKYVLDKEWFWNTVYENLIADLSWYGIPSAKFYELPHVEVKNWRSMRDAGVIQLVE